MKKIIFPIIIILLIIILIGVMYYILQEDTSKNNLIRVNYPKVNQVIQSPILIKGEARGYWFFEATFPIKLIDENSNIIVQHYATTKDEWMTENFVPFEAELNFNILEDQRGILILEKSNPSDLPENYDEIRIPVILKNK